MLLSFWNVGQQVLVLFILISVGALMSRRGMITEKGAGTMTDVVLYAVTPCVIINAFQRDYRPELMGGLLTAFAAAVVVLGFSVLLAELFYRRYAVERGVVLKFTVVFSNCGFMALPLQQAVLGDDGVFYGAAFIAVFNLFMWTYGLLVMSRRKNGREALKALLNPGVIGTVIGVTLFALSIRLPSVIASPVSFLAALNTPVPMLVIGYHLTRCSLKDILRDAAIYPAMAIRLVILPLAAMGVMLLLGVDSTVLCAVVIATASPVAAFTTMMASKYGHDSRLAAGIVSASTLFSVVTLPLVVGLAQWLSVVA